MERTAAVDYLHNHPDFKDIIQVVTESMSRTTDITDELVEKDYWIMHCLYGLQGFKEPFYMKGGTSLSKGFGIINRFSEDIDILIEPPEEMEVATGKNQNKPPQCESRKTYYDWLADNLKIDGITHIARDTAFDDAKYRSGGVRILYPGKFERSSDVKNGVLLEVGFDTVAPNALVLISSWAYDFAQDKVDIRDNRAKNVYCYLPGYTLVEKLQTISTKFRKEQEKGQFSANFMRHYYDVFHLLDNKEVNDFIGTENYHSHKNVRFRSGDEINISLNEAFQMTNAETFSKYNAQYKISQSLYYKEKPEFKSIIEKLRERSKDL